MYAYIYIGTAIVTYVSVFRTYNNISAFCCFYFVLVSRVYVYYYYILRYAFLFFFVIFVNISPRLRWHWRGRVGPAVFGGGGGGDGGSTEGQGLCSPRYCILIVTIIIQYNISIFIIAYRRYLIIGQPLQFFVVGSWGVSTYNIVVFRNRCIMLYTSVPNRDWPAC